MAATEILLPVRDYDLAATLDSGQVFRWRQIEEFLAGVIGKQFVCLTQTPKGIHATTPRRLKTGTGSASFSRPKLIWPPC